MYFINASLMYTSGTNFLLFANFGPVIGLLIASVFWRKDIPYLRDPRHMLWIFILAVTGSFGSTLLFINTLHHDSAPSLIGDILAFIAVFFDVLMTIGQIEYIKRHIRTDGLLLNVHIFSFVLVLSTPVVGVLYAAGHPVLAGLNGRTLLLGMGTGLIIGIGQLLNYEAFKRIDGYLAFMMFNLSVLLTFALETLVLRSLEPTALLILSGVLIVGSSIVAEMINSRCQRKGL
jgi:drug/metabolite transporter (DMT)-like permease